MTQIYYAFIPVHRQLKGVFIMSKRRKIFRTLTGGGFGGKPYMKPKPGIALYFIKN
jgi:hypothetical protein